MKRKYLATFNGKTDNGMVFGRATITVKGRLTENKIIDIEQELGKKNNISNLFIMNLMKVR